MDPAICLFWQQKAVYWFQLVAGVTDWSIMAHNWELICQDENCYTQHNQPNWWSSMMMRLILRPSEFETSEFETFRIWDLQILNLQQVWRPSDCPTFRLSDTLPYASSKLNFWLVFNRSFSANIEHLRYGKWPSQLVGWIGRGEGGWSAAHNSQLPNCSCHIYLAPPSRLLATVTTTKTHLLKPF